MRHNESEQLELYNLASDISEKNNLAQSNPEKFNELKTDWDQWNATLMEPRWGGARKFLAPGQKPRQGKAKAAGKRKWQR